MEANKKTRARFWSKVEKTETCWVWRAGKNTVNGYGQFWTGKKTTQAHRFLYQIYHGDLPSHVFVCHRCDNPPCVRPDHLFTGTSADNMRDKVSKGRGNYKKGIRRPARDEIIEILRARGEWPTNKEVLNEV